MKMAKFSDQIRNCVATSMDENGLTQTALAECTEVDQGAISRFLSGQSGLSLGAIDRICGVLNIKATNAREHVKNHSRIQIKSRRGTAKRSCSTHSRKR